MYHFHFNSRMKPECSCVSNRHIQAFSPVPRILIYRVLQSGRSGYLRVSPLSSSYKPILKIRSIAAMQALHEYSE